MKLLTEILGMKRPHKGVNERFVGEVILPRLGLPVETLVDGTGETMAYNICTDATSKSLFVAHLDTVHHIDEPNPLLFDMELEWMWKEDGTALGADDGAGVWLLYNMIQAGIPGSYLFTKGEERGGIGAKAVARHYPLWLSGFDRAVTFDRKGTTSIITHQMACGRCCSKEFALALGESLTIGVAESDYTAECIYVPDDGGVYTDTAEFTTMIPECTNVSAGYRNEHGGSETLDVGYLRGLLSACLKTKWEELPVKRDPTVVEYDYDYSSSWGMPLPRRSWKSKVYPAVNDDDNGWEYGVPPLPTEFDYDNPMESLMGMTDQEILDASIADPEWAGDLLILAKYGELDANEWEK
jgi:hypothetical protein